MSDNDSVTYADLQSLLRNVPHAASMRSLACSTGALTHLLVEKGFLTEDEVLQAIDVVEAEFDKRALNAGNDEIRAQARSVRERRRQQAIDSLTQEQREALGI